MIRLSKFFGFLIAITCHSICVAQDGTVKSKFSVSPTVLEVKDGSGSTLGLEYDFSSRLLDYDRPPSDPLNPLWLSKLAFDISGSGTVTTTAPKNPKNFLDFSGAFKSIYWNNKVGTLIASGQVKYETDQSFDNKQGVFGIIGTYAKSDLIVHNDSFAFQAGYSRVDPREDKERKAALGTMSLASFNRWEGEVLYMLPTNLEAAPMLEANFRYFAENNANASVRGADLAIFRLATLRISLKNDFFIAYSYGNLPFDRVRDRVVQAGWTYKLK